MCGTDTCPVHVRIDVREDVTSEFDSGRDVTYLDDLAVVTMDNPRYQLLGPLVAMAGLSHLIPGQFVTVVYRSGSGALGDLSAEELADVIVHSEEFVKHDDMLHEPYMDKLELTEAEREQYAATLNEKFHAKHDEIVLAVKAGLIS